MRLEEIALEHAAAFMNVVEDYKANDKENYSLVFDGWEDWSKKGFADFVRRCERDRADWRPKANKVSITRYVLLDENAQICGMGRMRFPLDEKLELSGGNLIFDVPPSRRRQGYGALTLNRMLFEAVRAGLARVLVSCPVKNVGARLSIEKNRGVKIDSSKNQDILRYWIHLR